MQTLDEAFCEKIVAFSLNHLRWKIRRFPERCLALRIWPGFLPRGCGSVTTGTWYQLQQLEHNANAWMVFTSQHGCVCSTLNSPNCNHFIYFDTWNHQALGHFGSPPLGMHGIGLAGWASYICLFGGLKDRTSKLWQEQEWTIHL